MAWIVLATSWHLIMENTMRHLLVRLGTLAGLLAISGAALADFNPPIGDFSTVPEPGVLELLALAAVVGWVVRKRGRK